MIPLDRRSVLKAGVGGSLIAAVGFEGSARAQQGPPISGPLPAIDAMREDGRFGTWIDIIDGSGLIRYLTGRYAFTMFAPTNEATSKYPYLVRQLLLGSGATGGNTSAQMPDLSRALRVVRAHSFAGLHPPSEFLGKTTTVTSFAGTPIEIDGTHGNMLTLHLKPTTMADTSLADVNVLMALNAIIYPIDSFTLESYFP